MSAQNVPPTEKRVVIVSTPAGDILFYERFNASKARRGVAMPAMGTAHHQKSRFPDHKVCGLVVDDEEGWMRIYYMASRASQEAYNWEHAETLSNEWPLVQQTWVVLRSDYITFPPAKIAPNVHTSLLNPSPREWTHIERNQTRLDPTTDGLFVSYRDTWYDISQPLIGQDFDSGTGRLLPFFKEFVPAGTAGAAMDSDGMYSTVTPINRDWSQRITRKAAGLMGMAVKGVAFRSWRQRDNWSWPRVLSYIHIRPIYADPSDAFSSVTGYSTTPVYLVGPYSGPCGMTIIERWTSKKPVEGGSDAWNEDSPEGESPSIPAGTALIETEIVFQGDGLKIDVPPCLHGSYLIWEGGFSQYYPATSPANWPASIVARVTVQPDGPGWTTRIMVVDAPSASGVGSGLSLLEVGSTATTITVQWTPQVIPGAPILTKLYVSTRPDFSGGFLEDYNGKVVTPPSNIPPHEHVIVGLERGVFYYARIERGAQISNILTMFAQPQAELAVTWEGAPDELEWGAVNVGQSQTRTIKVANPGLLDLHLTWAFTGAAAGDYSLTGLSTTIPQGGSYDVTIALLPSVPGARVGHLTITSDAPSGGTVVVDLLGTGIAPEIGVSFDGAAAANGSTLNLSSAGQGGALLVGQSRDSEITIHNEGTAPLTVSVDLVTDDEISFSKMPGATIAAGGTTTFKLTSLPTTSGVKTGVLTITSNDADESTYTLNLSLTTSTAPALEITNPYGAVMTSGQTVDWGRKLNVSSNSLVFPFRNIGSAQLTLSPALSGGQFTISPAIPATLDAGALVNVVIYYATTAVNNASHSATLTLTTNDPVNPSFVINLLAMSQTSATSTQEIQVEYPVGIAVATGQVIAFGKVVIGTPGTATIRLQNLGLATLSSLSISVGGTHSANVSTTGVPTTMAPGDTWEVTITFTPSALGARTATVTVNSNDANEPSVLFNLTCTGVVANALTIAQPATLVVGQANPTDQIDAVTQAILKGPGSVAVDALGFMAVADTDANRVLIFPPNMDEDGLDSVVVFGQADFVSSSPGCSASRLNRPTAVVFPPGGGMLVVDQGNHRVLRLNARPTANGAEADIVIGQLNMTAKTAACTASRLRLPVTACVDDDGVMWVVDQGNHRVLRWASIPTSNNAPAGVVVGQANFTTRTAGNQSTKLRSPHSVARVGARLLVSDYGNNRINGWNVAPTTNAAFANYVIGQTAWGATTSGLAANKLKSPASLAVLANGSLAVADRDNNRVLIFEIFPTSTNPSATSVLGQPDFTTGTAFNGGVSAISMSGPTGLCAVGTRLYVAGTTMRRVMQFDPAS